jgi:predicted Zn-dependent protease
MMELMLEAERAMAVGLLDKAERLYAQVAAADPHNSIAVMGLARIALERDNQRGAYLLARRALALDPDNPMASHMARRMAEIMAGRGEVPPDEPAAAPSAEPGFLDRIRRRR